MRKEHLTVLLEEMNGKFTAVLEGHAVLDRKIDAMRADIGEHFATVEVKLNALNSKIDTVDARLGKRIDAVETKLTQRIDAVESKLTQRIDAVETKLTRRIDTVEANLTEHIAAVAADLKAHRTDTEAHVSGYRVGEQSDRYEGKQKP